ncbi:MAG: PP0621 family protein [Burkholderiaceae bacterium]|nr:PP0621 family protein [Burkholderiaceae bacterium]MDH5207248.1 PP0621 family protein [Burkholderiaceae bacterium]
MGRIAFFLVLAAVVYLAWRSMRRRDAGGSARGRDARPPAPQAMVSCATCGLHVPRQEALTLGDRFFCCEEHRRNPPAA